MINFKYIGRTAKGQENSNHSAWNGISARLFSSRRFAACRVGPRLSRTTRKRCGTVYPPEKIGAPRRGWAETAMLWISGGAGESWKESKVEYHIGWTDLILAVSKVRAQKRPKF